MEELTGGGAVWPKRSNWMARAAAIRRAISAVVSPGEERSFFRLIAGTSTWRSIRPREDLRAGRDSARRAAADSDSRVRRPPDVRTDILAFPFCHVTSRGQKPREGYPEEPKILGEHLKKRRIDLGLRQKRRGSGDRGVPQDMRVLRAGEDGGAQDPALSGEDPKCWGRLRRSRQTARSGLRPSSRELVELPSRAMSRKLGSEHHGSIGGLGIDRAREPSRRATYLG